LTQAELIELLAEVAKGDAAAFERLYGATRAKLYGVLLRILGRPELADEVMQLEVLLHPLEEQLDLPAAFVEVGDLGRRRAQVVGHQGQHPAEGQHVIVKPGCFFTSRAGTPYTMTAGPEGVTYIETWGTPVTSLKTVWYDYGWVRK